MTGAAQCTVELQSDHWLPGHSQHPATCALRRLLSQITAGQPHGLESADQHGLQQHWLRASASRIRSRRASCFAPRFGVFYNGDENGPYSNPSPGFNPPYFASQNLQDTLRPVVLLPEARSTAPYQDLRSFPNGFPATSLTDPNTPSLFSLQLNLRTPYVIAVAWHCAVSDCAE